MELQEFHILCLLGEQKSVELRDAIREVEDQRLIGVWCAQTGMAVRAVVVAGVAVQWFIRGPLTLEQAREELMSGGPQPEASGSVH